MEFRFETLYDQDALMALSLAMRKTVRRKKHKVQCILGGVIVLAGLVRIALAVWKMAWDATVLVSLAAIVFVLYTILFEDRLSVKMQMKNRNADCPRILATFTPECYSTVLQEQTLRREYSEVKYLAETGRYFVLILGPSHAQVYDKTGMVGGTAEDFRAFLEEKTENTFLALPEQGKK